MGSFAIGSAKPVGGSSAVFTPTRRFKYQIVKLTTETLQQAVDRAAAAGPLVRRLTAPTSRANNTYAFALSEKPTRVFLNADELREQPTAFVGGVFDSAVVATPTSNVWYWDGAASAVVVYDRGNAVSTVTAVDHAAVLALDAPSYEAVILQPGVWVVGMGPEFSGIRPTQTATTLFAPLLNCHYSVVAAQYAGLSGLRVANVARDVSTVENLAALVFRQSDNCDGFETEYCDIVNEAGAVSVNSSAYVSAIMFASGSQLPAEVPDDTMPRAKGVVFRSSTIRSENRAWTMETLSGAFKGTVTFIDTPIHGNWFFDGRMQTIKFFNSPTDNWTGEGVAHPENSNTQDAGFMNTLVGPANCAAYPGYTYALEFHGSSVSPQDAANGRGSDQNFTTIAYAGLYPVYVNNSSIGGEVSFANVFDAALTPAQAALITSRNSRITPLRMTTFSTANRTPLVPQCFVDATITTSGTTARQICQFRISHDELKRRGRAVVTMLGVTGAAAGNNRVFNMHMGESATGTALARTATITDASRYFFARAEIQYQNGGLILVNLTNSNLGSFAGLYQHGTLVTGEDFVLYFEVIGTATGDIVVRDQRIDIAG